MKAVIAALVALPFVLSGCGFAAHPRNAKPTGNPTALQFTTAYCHTVPVERSFCQAVHVQLPGSTLRLAVARTEAERERGLMGLRNVPHREGMIFVYPDGADRMRGFWMKNTITPLDMVFVRGDGLVNEIAENVPATKPGTPDSEIAKREAVGRFVIELRAGEAEAIGLQPGMHLTIPSIQSQ